LPGCARAPRRTTVVVSAAASLKEVLTALDEPFSRRHPEMEVRHNFAASGTLQRQIERGAPVDVYIAAAARNMDELAAKELIEPGTRSTLARNALALIVPRGHSRALRRVADLQSAQVKRIALGAPDSVPAGRYAQEALVKLKLWNALQPKLVRAKDVREVLAQVALGNVEAGFVYVTDARVTDRVRVATTVPDDLHEPIVYPLAVVRGTRHEAAARAYAAYLQTAPARALLRRYGFIAP
jgi:molybdate transport system substrate-binding protein